MLARSGTENDGEDVSLLLPTPCFPSEPIQRDPSLKRSLCSTCSTTLVPGSSASIRVKSKLIYNYITCN